MVGGKQLEVGTDLARGYIHQHGGQTGATYKQRLNIKRAARAAARGRNAQAARILAKNALKKSRKVRLPARRFLGVSKRDRKRVTAILVDRLNEAIG